MSNRQRKINPRLETVLLALIGTAILVAAITLRATSENAGWVDTIGFTAVGLFFIGLCFVPVERKHPVHIKR